MSASPLSTGPADPALDPSASYALDPATTGRLVGHARVARPEAGAAMHRPTAPFTGQPLADVPAGTADDVVAAVERGRTAQAAWADVPVAARQRILLRLHDLALAHAADLMDLIQWESGKTRKQAYDEVAHIALTARYYARRSARVLAPRRALGAFPFLTRVEVPQVPKGVVGVISPWNYPFTLAMCDGIAALARRQRRRAQARPADRATALRGAELLAEAGLPDDLWQVVPGDGGRRHRAVDERRPRLLHRVDRDRPGGRRARAPPAGRLLARARRQEPDAGARRRRPRPRGRGRRARCFASAGQLCVSMERLFVADEVYDAFVDRFLRRVQAMRLSAALDFGGDMGSLVSAAAAGHRPRARGRRGRAGRRPCSRAAARGPTSGRCSSSPPCSPACTPAMTCYANETFGPVVAVHRFGADDEAVARANEGELRAQRQRVDAATRPARRAVARRIRCGTVNINEAYGATFGSIDSPMGGMRESGLGRRQGPEGLLRFSEPQTVARSALLPIAPGWLSRPGTATPARSAWPCGAAAQRVAP